MKLMNVDLIALVGISQINIYLSGLKQGVVGLCCFKPCWFKSCSRFVGDERQKSPLRRPRISWSCSAAVPSVVCLSIKRFVISTGAVHISCCLASPLNDCSVQLIENPDPMVPSASLCLTLAPCSPEPCGYMCVTEYRRRLSETQITNLFPK